MNPRQAAELIGISHQQVLYAVRKGLLKATKKKLNNGNPNAFTYEIRQKEVERYRDNRPKRGPKPKVGGL